MPDEHTRLLNATDHAASRALGLASYIAECFENRRKVSPDLKRQLINAITQHHAARDAFIAHIDARDAFMANAAQRHQARA